MKDYNNQTEKIGFKDSLATVDLREALPMKIYNLIAIISNAIHESEKYESSKNE